MGLAIMVTAEREKARVVEARNAALGMKPEADATNKALAMVFLIFIILLWVLLASSDIVSEAQVSPSFPNRRTMDREMMPDASQK